MIGLLAHADKPRAREAAQLMVRELDHRAINYVLEKQTARLIGRSDGMTEQEMADVCHLLVVLGGDGTILRVLHKLGDKIRPIFGVNIGSLGFLTCVASNEYERAADAIASENYVLSQRSLLSVDLVRDGKTVCQNIGLNDAVVSRGERSQLVLLEVRIDDIVLTTYYADGLIIATPTGSTAYSLSAGGPILMPDSGSMLICPICPHVLTNRSVVVSDHSEIRVRSVDKSNDVFVSVDGRSSDSMASGDTLIVRKSATYLPLAMLPELSFSDVLCQKLKWSGSNL